MKKEYDEFIHLLDNENKEGALNFIMKLIQEDQIDIIEIYEQFLAPSLNTFICKTEDHNVCIWKEHIRTAIVRTIVESCYPYVIQKQKSIGMQHGKTVLVLCPPEEYHDLGARMTSDFFTIAGFHSIFIGGNTPFQDFVSAIDALHPDMIAISVSNFFNLVVTKKIISDLKANNTSALPIVVGGNAFSNHRENVNAVGADFFASSFQDILALAKEGIRL